jgi:hypothetical protein
LLQPDPLDLSLQSDLSSPSDQLGQSHPQGLVVLSLQSTPEDLADQMRQSDRLHQQGLSHQPDPLLQSVLSHQ